MTYVLRSPLRQMFFRYITTSYYVDREAHLLIRNFSVPNRLICSRPPFRDDNAPYYDQRYLRKLLLQLETDSTKRGLVYLNDLNAIIEILEMKKSVSQSLARKLLSFCGELLAHEPPVVRIQLVQKMWNSFKKCGVKYDIFLYNTLMKVYFENNCPINPEGIMKELEAARLIPDADTYSWFIAKYCQEGDIVKTSSLLKKMREKNVPVNVDIYRSLIICHSKNNDMEAADNIVNIVDKVNPDALGAAHSALIIEYIRRGDLEKALCIFNTATKKSLYTLNEYFDILVELAIHDHENEFYRELNEYKRPNNYNIQVPIYISKLIAVGKPEYAYTVLRTMHTHKGGGNRHGMGPFFIANLVKYNVPDCQIIKLCLDMTKIKFNEFSLEVAMHESLRLKKEDLALKLFHAAKCNNRPVRLHYFYPLLMERGRKKDINGIFNLLDIMKNDHGLQLNTETLRYYIIPYVYSNSMDVTAFMIKFKPYGGTISTVVSSIVHYLLTMKEFKRAAEVAGSYGASYPRSRYEELTVDLYVETKDCNSFVKLMKAFCMGCIWQTSAKNQYIWQTSLKNQDQDPDDAEILDHRNHFDSMVFNAVEKLMRERDGSKYVVKLFQCMLENNMTISSEKIDAIERMLSRQKKLNETMLRLLKQFKSEEVGINSTINSEIRATADEKSLQRLYEDMEAGTTQSDLTKKYLFNLCARSGNLEKLLELKNKLESANFKLDSGMYSLVISSLVEHGKWEEALKIFHDRMKNSENFYLDYLKLNRFALLLVQNDRIEDARNVLSVAKCMKTIKLSDKATETYRDLLICLSEKGLVEAVEEFFEIYRTGKLGFITHDILAPVIRAHLMKNDLETTFKRFKQFVAEYNINPCVKDIMQALILNGNEEKLDEFISICSSSRGEGPTLYDLVLVLSKLNEIAEAKRILQLPVLKLSSRGAKRLTTESEKYCAQNDAKNLLNLFLITRDTKLFDRDELSSKILTACSNSNDVESAQLLWTEMQDENIVPSSSEFFSVLAKLFKNHGLPVNFDHSDEFTENRSTTSSTS